MSQSTATAPKTRGPLNGVDTPALFATIDAVSGQRELARFQFRASNRWISGTHSRSTIHDFTGAGGVHEHSEPFVLDGDHPTVLVGGDNGPTPVEVMLAGLAGCLTAGIANIAAARGVKLTSVESTVEGDIDLSGLLGLDDSVRNGYQAIRVHFHVEGDADEAVLRRIVEQSQARSAVLDVITNQVPVDVTVNGS